MAIGPLELNGAITRTQDYSVQKQNEDNKGMVDQSNIQTHFHKEVDEKARQVRDADNTENYQPQYDAKEKGKGQYEGDGGKQRNKKGSNQEKVIIKGQTRFDIKI